MNSYPRYILKNKVLIRECLKSRTTKDVLSQIVAPCKLRDRIISLAHDSVYSGHLGINKTRHRILNHFFWPGCYSDIRRFCQSCVTCQRAVSNRPCRVPLASVPVVGRPFQKIAIDIVGPINKSRRGNRFVLVMIDLASKYSDAVHLRNIDSNVIAEALVNMFSRVGLPDEILHDQGTNFMSSVMTKFNNLLRIKKVNTTPYNPTVTEAVKCSTKLLSKC